MAFDIAGALKAGYSSKEIADHLLNEPGFDVRAARSAGYSDDEIVQHLAQTPASGGYEVPKVDLLNVNPFEAPSGQLQRPQGGVTLDPTVAGVPMMGMESVGASADPRPAPTARDRVNAALPVRFAREASNQVLGVAQGLSGAVVNTAGRMGYEIPAAEAVRDYTTDVITANREDSRRALEMAAAEREQNAAEAGLGTPNPAAKWIARADAAGAAGGAAPWALLPQVGLARTGLSGAAIRTAANTAAGAVGGYFAPQEQQYNADTADSNAFLGALFGAGLSIVGETAMPLLRSVASSRKGRALLETIDPEKLPEFVDELRNYKPPIAGYEPTAAQASVGMDEPRFAGLFDDIREYPGVAGQNIRQQQSQAMARADVLDNFQASRAVPDTLPLRPDDPVPLTDVAESLQASRRQVDFEDAVVGIREQGAKRVAADETQAAMAEVNARRNQVVAQADAARQHQLTAAEKLAAAEQLRLDAEQARLTEAPERFQSEFGESLRTRSQELYREVRDTRVQPEYDRAYELAGDVRSDVPATKDAVGRIMSSQAVELNSEFSTQTLKALQPFGFAEEGVSATPGVTLPELAEALRAVNRDIAQAKKDSTLAARLRLLQEVHAALKADLEASSFPPEAVAQFNVAQAAWQKHILPRWRTGDVNTRLGEETLRNTDRLASSEVVSKYLRSEEAAREFVALARDADGAVDPTLVQTMREGVEDLFMRQVERNAEGFDPVSASKWVRDHRDELRVLEEVSPGLRQSLTDYASAARRVVQTRTELNNGLKELRTRLNAEFRSAKAQAQQTARADLARIREGASTRKVADPNLLEVERQRITAAQEQQKSLEQLLNFSSGQQMARKVIDSPQVRTEVLTRLRPAGRRALAQQVIWDANNASDRLAYLRTNENAIREVLRAADPSKLESTMTSLREGAELAAQQPALNARVSAARSQIGHVPMEGANRRAYEAARAELTRGATPEQLSSLDALERDFAQEEQLRTLVRGVNSTRSEIETQTRLAENHGVHVPGGMGGMLAAATRIWRIMRGAMTRGQAEELARIMFDPKATADFLEQSARSQAGWNAAQQTVRRATFPAANTINQERNRP